MHTLHNCLTQFITVYRRHLTYKQFVKAMKEISQKMYAHVGRRPKQYTDAYEFKLAKYIITICLPHVACRKKEKSNKMSYIHAS